MTARLLPFRSSYRREQDRRRREVEAAMREALNALVAGLNGKLPLADAVHLANRALAPAVIEACRSEVV